jgi:asparagine synthase (glutamine-hydrolysing)
MCGIVGVMKFDGIPPSADRAVMMADRIIHRGPDDSGVYSDDCVALASRRLSILDLSPNGHMPMVDEASGFVLVYNGEIYNYRELKEELRRAGEVFRSETDTEVLLKLLRREGPGALRKLRGMFAFACWDPKHKTLLLARDHFGIKPVYYRIDRDGIVFGSEIKAILEKGETSPRLFKPALAQYFTFGFVASPATMYEGIQKLAAGHYIVQTKGKADAGVLGAEGIVEQPKRYWDPLDETLESAKSGAIVETDLERDCIRVFSESVSRHLISDVPVGLYLSGGIDSSAILALMSRERGDNIPTFTVGFSGPEEYSEIPRARFVSKTFRSRHHELVLSEADLVENLVPMVRRIDEPIGDAATFPMYVLSKHARNVVTVVLTGEGGDEFFGGYRRYSADGLWDWYHGIPRAVLRPLLSLGLKAFPGMPRIKRGLGALDNDDPIARAAAWQQVFGPFDLDELLLPEWRAEPGTAFGPLSVYLSQGLARLDRKSALMYADQKTRLADAYCEKVDRSTMLASIEARVPFLDLEVARFAARLDSSMKIRGFKLKYLLRKTLSSILPPEVIGYPKRGFAVPSAAWFRGQLNSLMKEVLLSEDVKRRGILNVGKVRSIINEFEKGGQPVSEQVWLLFAFEIWCREHLDRVPSLQRELLPRG